MSFKINRRINKIFSFIFLLNESLRLSFDDIDEIGRCGTNKIPLLCNGGGRLCEKRLGIVFKFTGRGGIGGGIISADEFVSNIS